MLRDICGKSPAAFFRLFPKFPLLFALAALVALSACREEAGPQASISSIDFPDPNMKACAESSGKEFVDEVVSLNCIGYEINDLAGTENFTNLRSVNFRFNRLRPLPDGSGGTVPALAPLSGLSNLEFINVADNRGIKDASPIGGLSSLVSLNMSETSLDNVGLGGLDTGQLTSLELLYLFETDLITNASPLASLTTLTFLDLGNDITTGVAGQITASVTSLTTLVNAQTIILDGHTTVLCTDITTLRTALPTTAVVHPCP